MRKILCATFCVTFCVAVVLMLPRFVTSRPFVDKTFCMNEQCHILSDLQEQHQGDCTLCHAQAPPETVYTVTCTLSGCHPLGNPGRCDLVRFHNNVPPEPAVTVNGLYCIDCHINCQESLTCEVAINPASATVDPGAKQTFTASTTCGGEAKAGDYTWSVAGGTADTTTGNSIEYTAGTVPGKYTVTVTDRVNGAVTASAGVAIGTGLCGIDVIQEQVARSPWFPLPAIITIAGTDTAFTQFGTRVQFEGAGSANSVISVGALVIPSTQTIQQFVLILPSILTGGGSDGESETVTVTVTNGGCDTGSDTFELQMLPISADN